LLAGGSFGGVAGSGSTTRAGAAVPPLARRANTFLPQVGHGPFQVTRPAGLFASTTCPSGQVPRHNTEWLERVNASPR
jgi:hypothetical protein